MGALYVFISGKDKKEEAVTPMTTAKITPIKKVHAPKEFSCDLIGILSR